MKTTAIALGLLSLAVAAPAFAAPRDTVTDAAYLQAVRCKGLAAGAGQDDPALDAFVKEAGRFRMPAVVDRGEAAYGEAKRIARRDKARAQSELAGACVAYRGSATAASGQ